MLLVLMICDCVRTQTVTCSRYGIEKNIEGIDNLKIFRQYEYQCGDISTIVLKYAKCKIESIGLNITRLKQNFPSLKTLYWYCTGYCYVSESIVNVNVIGCEKGKYK